MFYYVNRCKSLCFSYDPHCDLKTYKQRQGSQSRWLVNGKCCCIKHVFSLFQNGINSNQFANTFGFVWFSFVKRPGEMKEKHLNTPLWVFVFKLVIYLGSEAKCPVFHLCFTLLQTATGGLKINPRGGSQKWTGSPMNEFITFIVFITAAIIIIVTVTQYRSVEIIGLQSHTSAYLQGSFCRKIAEFLFTLFKKGVVVKTLLTNKWQKCSKGVAWYYVPSSGTTQLVSSQHLCRFFCCCCCFFKPLIRRHRKRRKRLLFLHTRHCLPESKLLHCATIFEQKL